ncbi:hypothetical protein JXO52_14570 [bacterium]|nr:hypothetical protein [bacterium]
MTSLHFNYRDIFRSARVAFHPQRIWLQLYGLGIGYAGYLVLTYLSLFSAGEDPGVVWARYGLFPSAFSAVSPFYSKLIAFAAVLFVFYWWLAAATAVARASYMELKGHVVYTWRAAMRFALKKKGGAVISSPLTLAVMFGLVTLGGYVVGLLGRIPWAGEIGIALFTLLWYGISFFLVFIALAFAVSLLIAPAVIATTDDDAFEGIFQSFALLHGQPWRLVLYELLLLAVAAAGFVVFAFAAKLVWQVMNAILIRGMGSRYGDITYQASYLVQNAVYPLVVWLKVLLGQAAGYIFFTGGFFSQTLPLPGMIAAWITALFMIVIGGVVIAYPLAVFNTGQALIFLILKKIKEDDNLLVRKDEEEENLEDLDAAETPADEEQETAGGKDSGE